MISVGILYICTGQYSVFWKDFYLSSEKFFLKECKKKYFVFTDDLELDFKNNSNVEIVYHEFEGWPFTTMNRFSTFLQIEKKLYDYNYLFFLNANVLFQKEITAKMVLPDRHNLVVVRHPGFYDQTPDKFTYDRNPKSKAFIPYGQGNVYVCGGINGGKTLEYIKMIKELKKWTDFDYANGVIALWHDESMLNKYILDRDDYDVKDCSFCYPEGWVLPFEPYVLVRDKQKWIDVDKIKHHHRGLFSKIRRCIWKKM